MPLMLQISADLTLLSQPQREALADFITSFPNTATTEVDPVIPCPIVEVDPKYFAPEDYELGGEPLPVFDAPLPAGVSALVRPVLQPQEEIEALVKALAPLPAGVLAFPSGGPSQVDPPASNLDKNGLPWDDRIHASSKAKTQDGSWRTKRGVDAGVLAAVQAELKALMGLPSVPTWLPGKDGPVHNTPVVAEPTVPPPPAVPAAAVVPGITSSPVPSAPTVAPAVPSVPSVVGSPFISLINFASAKNHEGKLTEDEIKAACQAVGVPDISVITNRPDLCPHVEASLRLLVANR